MNDQIYEKYRTAGRIAADAREYGINLIKPGVHLLEVANKVEDRILRSGAGLAFPVNISINEVAAHYSPRHDDTHVFRKGDVVKLDVGAHISGFIADTAVTVEVETNEYSDLIKASSDALDTAIGLIKPGFDLSEIGRAVQETITSYGYKPIDNLTGHSLNQYILHAGTNIPNVYDLSGKNIAKTGDVFAIEPFASTGAGHVIQGAGSNIYICNRSFRSSFIRQNKYKVLYNKLLKEYRTLPFAQRWSQKFFENNDIILRKLSFLGFIKHYPQLVDAKKGIVSQKEHTVIITENGCEVIT